MWVLIFQGLAGKAFRSRAKIPGTFSNSPTARKRGGEGRGRRGGSVLLCGGAPLPWLRLRQTLSAGERPLVAAPVSPGLHGP